MTSVSLGRMGIYAIQPDGVPVKARQILVQTESCTQGPRTSSVSGTVAIAQALLLPITGLPLYHWSFILAPISLV